MEKAGRVARRVALGGQRRWKNKFKIWPSEVDSFDRIEPRGYHAVTEQGSRKIHEIMGWLDPKIDDQPESEEPTYPTPPATRPDQLAFQDIGKMYCLSDDDMKAYFQEGFAGLITKAFAPPLQPRGFLYRKLSHLLNVYIGKFEDWDTKEDVLYELRDGKSGFILDGPHGCGKSAILNQVVHSARSRGILTVFIPDATEWTSGSFVMPSTVVPGFFDNPNECLELLRYFCRCPVNQRILSERPLSRVYPMPRLGQQDKLETVWDLLHFAFDDVETCPIVFKYFLDELIAIKDIPVLFVVDSFDRLCKYTEYHEMHPDVLRGLPIDGFDIKTLPKKRIHSSRLVLSRALNYIMTANEPNKLVIAASTREVGANAQGTHDFTPFQPDQDTMLHTLKVPPRYDEYEMRSILRFYLETMEASEQDSDGRPQGAGWSWRRLEMPSFERTLYKIRFLTDGNPYHVWFQSEMRHHWLAEYERQRQMLGRMRSRLVENMQSQRNRMIR
eukprot:Hpha_TRINITY_DN16643_c1_g3::TRINITY_DN16643_c1_g3_i1::g.181923::m.181923/K17408/DAP3, MRPS29; small subunit ribosomal protein S29